MNTPRSEMKCSIENCKQVYRAKGYCDRHYNKWRRGELAKGPYKTCVQGDCRKKISKAGLCEEHYNALYKKAEAAPAAVAAPAPAAAPAAS